MSADPPVAVPGPASAHCTCPHATPNEASDEGFPCCAFGPCCCGSVPGPADPVVSPADTIRRAIWHSETCQRKPGCECGYCAANDALDALLAVGERDKAEIEALTAAVEGLLDVGTRSRIGDPSLDPEEWFAIRDYAQKVLKDGVGAALRESRERDRQQIALLTEALERIADTERYKQFPPHTGAALLQPFEIARAVLAGEEDAANG